MEKGTWIKASEATERTRLAISSKIKSIECEIDMIMEGVFRASGMGHSSVDVEFSHINDTGDARVELIVSELRDLGYSVGVLSDGHLKGYKSENVLLRVFWNI